MTVFHIDNFSGSLSELPKGKRSMHNALRVLEQDPRVSCFERGTPWLERLLQDLVELNLVEEEKAVPYPWCKFHLTDLGRHQLHGPHPASCGCRECDVKRNQGVLPMRRLMA